MVVTLPTKLEDWNIEILNELVKYKDIESETFDFKGVEINQLYLHICAMANTSGGFIVLGVDEVKGKDGKTLVGFRKVGFKHGREDHVGLQIGNNVFKIDPNPKVSLTHILDKNGKFYTVLKTENEISKKPYFIKDTAQCYVRVGNSSRPASRSVVLNLFTNLIENRGSVERLRVATSLLKESLLHVSDDLGNIGASFRPKIAPLDLTFIRSAVLSSEWFLIENDLLGKHIPQGLRVGINSVLHDLDTLNTYINAYNNRPELEKFGFEGFFDGWKTGRNDLIKTVEFLDKIIKASSEFLARYQ